MKVAKQLIDKNGIPGYKKCPIWLRQRYLTEAEFWCTDCEKRYEDKDLEIHRIVRGNKGGLYTDWPIYERGSNVKVCCIKHHKLYHSKEIGCRNK